MADPPVSVPLERALCCHRLEGTVTGLRLDGGDGAPLVTLRRKWLLSFGRFVGTTPLLTASLITKTVWSNMTYRTVITDAATGDVLGEYTTAHAFEGDLTLKGRTFTLTPGNRPPEYGEHYVQDADGRRLAAVIYHNHPCHYEFVPLDLRPCDPDRWLLALILLHYCFNFQG